MQQSKRQTPRIDYLQSKNTTYHSAEGNARIFIDSDTVLDDKRYHYAFFFLPILTTFCCLCCCFQLLKALGKMWATPPLLPPSRPPQNSESLEVMTLKCKRWIVRTENFLSGLQLEIMASYMSWFLNDSYLGSVILDFLISLKLQKVTKFDQEVIITGQERTQQAQLKYKSFGFENQSFSLKIQEHISVSERNAYQYMVVTVT